MVLRWVSCFYLHLCLAYFTKATTDLSSGLFAFKQLLTFYVVFRFVNNLAPCMIWLQMSSLFVAFLDAPMQRILNKKNGIVGLCLSICIYFGFFFTLQNVNKAYKTVVKHHSNMCANSVVFSLRVRFFFLLFFSKCDNFNLFPFFVPFFPLHIEMWHFVCLPRISFHHVWLIQIKTDVIWYVK